MNMGRLKIHGNNDREGTIGKVIEEHTKEMHH
jgi:hypothetical protein